MKNIHLIVYYYNGENFSAIVRRNYIPSQCCHSFCTIILIIISDIVSNETNSMENMLKMHAHIINHGKRMRDVDTLWLQDGVAL